MSRETPSRTPLFRMIGARRIHVRWRGPSDRSRQ